MNTPARRINWPELRSALWFKPAIAVVVALTAGAALSAVELAPDSLLGRLTFRGDADDARQLLTAVTSTMITVTSLVFALTVVALQIASTQFSPRLMRTFLRDNGTQIVLSTFVGTVAYSLAGLYTVGGQTATGARFVPRLAVSVSLVLALISVGMLVYYIQHFTNGIRISTIMLNIEHSTLHLLRSTLPPLNGDPREPARPDLPPDATVVPAPRSGYVQGFALDSLHDIAARDDIHVRFDVHVGYHVIAGGPVAWIWGAVDASRHVAAVQAGMQIRSERRFEHDFGFALRQLVDIALRAVAPSRNDPYTAVQAIHHLAVIFSDAAGRRFGDDCRRDPGGACRVWAPVNSFESHLGTACHHLRWSTSAEVRVTLALLRMLGDVGVATTDGRRRAALAEQVDLVLEDALWVLHQPADVARVRQTAERARRKLT